MAIDGNCKLTRLTLASLSIDYTKVPCEVRTVATLSEPSTGNAAIVRASSSIWSSETQKLLKELIASLEGDIARSVLDVGSSGPATDRAPTGIGEHLQTDIAVEDA